MRKYRRIEVNMFHRRVTIVSGEWPKDIFDGQPVRTDGEAPPDDGAVCEPVEPDSPEGQLILVEAVRSLEQRLSPEARATICFGQATLAPKRLKRIGFFHKLQSFYQLMRPKAVHFSRKEK